MIGKGIIELHCPRHMTNEKGLHFRVVDFSSALPGLVDFGGEEVIIIIDRNKTIPVMIRRQPLAHGVSHFHFLALIEKGKSEESFTGLTSEQRLQEGVSLGSIGGVADKTNLVQTRMGAGVISDQVTCR